MKLPTHIPITYIIILLMGLFIFYQTCNSKKLDPPKETIVNTRDTTWNPQPIIVVQPSQPVVYNSQPGNIPVEYSTRMSSDVKELSKQLEPLARDFYAVNRSKDSIQLKDSSGNNVGTVNLDHTVSENKIQETNASYKLRFPVITDKTVITRELPRKRQVYGILGLTGSQSSLVRSFETGLLYKDRNDRIFSLKGGIQMDGKAYVGAGVGIKIKF